MHIDFRYASTSDFEWCASVLQDGFEQRPDLHRRLPEIWTALLADEAILIGVVEDHDCSNRLVVFGATAFVSDRYIQTVVSDPEPNLAVHILERELRRRGRVILRPDAVRKQSAGEGLNLLILHYWEALDGYGGEECFLIRDMMVRRMLETHRRQNLKSLSYELYGEEDVPYVVHSGARLISDFKDWYEKHNRPLPDPPRRPFLFALYREDAQNQPAAWMSWLFFSCRARVGLSPAEQRIAARALDGETDAQLAHNPEISPNTVRRHWRSIYKKVEAAGIQLIPSDPIESGKRKSDSPEVLHRKKRPFLLNFLRQHPEELRPQAAVKVVKRRVVS